MKFLKLFQGKNSEPVSEAEQLARYRGSGDPALVGALYEPYMEMVFGVCYQYLRDEDESKDAVMQVFEKLLADLRAHEVTNFKSWLHSVARNHCLMKLRAAKVLVTTDEITEAEADVSFGNESTDHALFTEDRLNALEYCMKTLVNEQRVSIELFYMQQKCYREIAGDTGFDLSKVKSYIQNAKRNLKICMDKNGSY